ncbi:hypothetical protein [Streptomyces sp. NPDC058297]|uniref:hypothetical protein n=1 Tax=Streptomyces sp. NPDC058297 TaxID=3346433 RepID=UPI0036EF86CA
MDRNRHMASRTSGPRTIDSAPVGLLVDFDSGLGSNCQALSDVKPGTTVTALVTVRHLASGRGGRARGILIGSGGQAIFTIDADANARLQDSLTQGVTAQVRGTVTRIGSMNTISVRGVQVVTV